MVERSRIFSKMKENWKVFAVPVSFTVAGHLVLSGLGANNADNIRTQIILYASSAATYIIGHLADIHSTLQCLNTEELREANPFLSDNPDKEELLELVYPQGYIYTVIAAVWPSLGITLGSVKILTALHNYRVTREVAKENISQEVIPNPKT